MKDRCYRKTHIHYNRYGGRGITVCPEWEHSYETFRDWALSHGYADDLSIDRIDNDKGYSPENCRWISLKIQNRNRRSNHLITYQGKTQTVVEWAEELGIPAGILHQRIYRGWSDEDILTVPIGGKRLNPKT